jgi:pimeloyl-ACP methyl ester carboxylesterase
LSSAVKDNEVMARAPATPDPLRLSRRDWLRLGVPAALGLGSPRVGANPSPGDGFGRAKSVVVIFTSGGQSQLDTWDPKPNAPEEIRGAFRTIQTANPSCGCASTCRAWPRGRTASRFCAR